MTDPIGFMATDVDDVVPVPVGPGCTRRDLKSRAGLRLWVVDMAPGSEWPSIDDHGAGGEDIFVVAGELIEEQKRYGPGSYLHFLPNSSHRPRTETGVRLFGLNLLDADEAFATSSR